MKKLEGEVGVKRDKIKLVFQGVIVDEKRFPFLKDYGVFDESTIHLVMSSQVFPSEYKDIFPIVLNNRIFNVVKDDTIASFKKKFLN